MKKNRVSVLYRAGWYTLGLLLFFTPFAYYQKVLLWLLNSPSMGNIHALCFRMTIQNMLTGKNVHIFTVATISTLLLFLAAFLAGPFFCGRLCAAGALPEYLGRLLPDKWKIDWHRGVNPVPIRYGFLAGYLLSPFLTGSIACAFCNFSFLERLINGGLWGDFGVLGSTTILTALLWLIIFGVMTKGGRGYCSFLCPVGAVQSLIHSIGARFDFTYKLRYAKDKCVDCSVCIKNCPMGALQKEMETERIDYQIHNCITCRQCEAVCPVGALSYGRGKNGWSSNPLPESIPVLTEEGIQ